MIVLNKNKPEVEEGPFFTKTMKDRHPEPVYTPGIGAALAKGGLGVIDLLRKTRELLEHPEPLDYLQVGAIGDTKVWIIDDGSVITWLLPEEY